MKNPFKIKIKTYWKIWIMFALTHITWQLAIVSGAEKTMTEKLMDPLYLMGVCIMFLYGLLAISFGRNIKALDIQIKELKDTNANQWQKINDINSHLCNLQGRHDTMMDQGGHK
jgi:hypothetical protein